jgi:secernin
MCDTQIIRKDGITYFAKNSDREPSEAQLVVSIPAIENDRVATLKATYLEIPQTARRYGLILSKPYWIWGAEMGINDQGVVIGNEAVFTKVHDRQPGLLGMDLLRLGLERGSNARHALAVITEHLEQYGQGGSCSLKDQSFCYDNSFIIADAEQAWVLETANRHWVARPVVELAAISNTLTIGTDYQLKSRGLEDFARQRGLFIGKGELNFAHSFTAPFYTYFAGAANRLSASYHCLRSSLAAKEIDLKMAMDNLRVHHHSGDSHFARSNSDICMHSCGYIRRSQTCGSMVARLTECNSAAFFTGTSAPCLSIFKPVSFNSQINFGVLTVNKQQLKDSLWYKHEQIHRRLIFHSRDRRAFIESRDETEKAILKLFDNPAVSVDVENYREADRLVMNWQQEWQHYFSEQPFHYGPGIYSIFWRRLNRELISGE